MTQEELIATGIEKGDWVKVTYKGRKQEAHKTFELVGRFVCSVDDSNTFGDGDSWGEGFKNIWTRLIVSIEIIQKGLYK